MGKGSKGLKWINNGITNKRVSLDQLGTYLNDGWVVGQLPTTLGHVWINKDGKNTTVDKSRLDEYLANGWSRGKILSKNEVNRVKVNKNGKTKLISKDLLDEYLADDWSRGIHQKFRWITNNIEEKWTDIELPEGWIEGRLYKNPNEIISVYNDTEVIEIKKVDLHEYQQLGYKIGKGKKVGLYEGSTKNTIWMNNGIDCVCIQKTLENEYIDKGYVRGNLNIKDRIHVYKNDINKYIKPDELEQYLLDGYLFGQTFSSTLDKIWIYKNNRHKVIAKDKLAEYLLNGWTAGRLVRASEGKIWIHKEEVSTYIDISLLPEYLDKGWHSGKKGAMFYINNGKEDILVDWDDYNLHYRNDESWVFGTRDHGCSSIIENEFKTILDDNDIKYSQHFYINHNGKRYFYDFKVDKILIELNPSATHNSTWSPYNNPLEEDYHYNKSQAALENGYRCINIWDWDDINILMFILKPRQTVYARNCEIREVTSIDARDFLNQYHFQGYAKDAIRYGLYYKNELVSIMTFDTPRYNKNYDFELVRYCSNKNIIGGAEKLFKHFTSNYKGSIISYCDLSKFTGDIYNKLGFTYKNYSIGKHWYSFDLSKHITDNLLRQLGFDKLFGSIYGNFGKGTSNNQLMIDHGFVEIYDCGQAVYTYNKR